MATRIDLAKRLLQRAGDDEAAATSAVAWARGIVEAAEEPVAPEDEAVD